MPSPATNANSAVKANGKSTLQLEPGTYTGGMDIKSSVSPRPGRLHHRRRHADGERAGQPDRQQGHLLPDERRVDQDRRRGHLRHLAADRRHMGRLLDRRGARQCERGNDQRQQRFPSFGDRLHAGCVTADLSPETARPARENASGWSRRPSSSRATASSRAIARPNWLTMK